ncbi:MAG: glycosyltransferase family 4 protein [Bacteroidia bacterium]
MSKKKPKVLILATSRKTRGGITSVVKAHEQGKQWEIYHCKWIETQIDRGLIIKIYYLISSFFQFIFLVPFYDIVHIHTGTKDCARLKSPYVLIAKIFKKKVIVHLHIGNQIKSYKKDFFFNYLLRNADLIIVLSKNIKALINELFGYKIRIEVIYNPCHKIEFFERSKPNKQILYAGILNKNKGYEDLIKAFSIIAKKHKDWKLIFAGNGEIENAKIISKEFECENQIEFRGWVNSDVKEQLYRESSIYCLASYEEGFPMSVLEAWSYGIPVVCTLVGGLPDVVSNEENALVFKSGDIEYLAYQLERLITDAKLRDQISLKSKELSNTTFKLENINSQLAEIYASI